MPPWEPPESAGWTKSGHSEITTSKRVREPLSVAFELDFTTYRTCSEIPGRS
jgi:hypothetical protein